MEQYDLPNGWVWSTLEDCVDILDSQRVPINASARKKRKGDVPYYGATGQVGWIDDYLFDEELLLVGEDGAPFLERNKPKAYIIVGKSWVNNHAHVLRAKSQVSSNKYLCYYLNTFDYHGYVNGTTRLKLTQGALKTIPVPLAPLLEQEQIVKQIEKMYSRIEKIKNMAELAIKQCVRLSNAVLAKAFCGELVGQNPTDEPASVLLEKIKSSRKKSS